MEKIYLLDEMRIKMNGLTRSKSAMMRGIAALLVIVAHYAKWYITVVPGGKLIMLCTKLGRYGVAIFFAVSGYGLLCSARKGIDITFLKRRLLNVYVPYVVISGCVKLLSKGQWGTKAIISWLLGLNAWFIFVIMIFYVVFYLCYRYSRHKIVAIEAGVFLISVCLAIWGKEDYWYASNVSFGLGILIKVFEDKIYPKLWLLFFLGGGFAVSAVIYMIAADKNQLIYLLFKIVASALWTLLVMFFFLRCKIRRIQVLEIVGMASLECYLIHEFIIGLFQSLPITPLFICGISLIVTLVIACLLNGLVRKGKE